MARPVLLHPCSQGALELGLLEPLLAPLVVPPRESQVRERGRVGDGALTDHDAVVQRHR